MKARITTLTLLLQLLALPLHPLRAQEEQITLLFAGDLMAHESQLKAARRAAGGDGYSYSDCFRHVRDQIAAADIAVANLEVPLAGKRYAGYPMFCAPDSYLHAIKEAGFDVLLTANNHCMDRQAAGLVRTHALIDSLGLLHLGSYNDTAARRRDYPLIVEKKGFRIALLNYTYGTNGIEVTPPLYVNGIDTAQIARDIAAAQLSRPHAIIACMHWGEEFRPRPEAATRRLTEWLLAHGVDHVIGGHPHVLQPMEIHRHSGSGKGAQFVAYSLGNFLSGMFARTRDGGMMVKLTLQKSDPLRAKLVQSSYRLVWVARPERDGVPNFSILPSDYPADSLPAAGRSKFMEFLSDSRQLLSQCKLYGILEEE